MVNKKDDPKVITSVETVGSGSADVEMEWDAPGVGKNGMFKADLPKVECSMPNPFDGPKVTTSGLLNMNQVQCLQTVFVALGTGKFRHKSLDDPETRRDLKEFLRVNLEDLVETSLDHDFQMREFEAAEAATNKLPDKPSTAMESAQKYIEMQRDGSDYWSWESNDYELCPVCQESINPDRPHECVDTEGMKTELLRYLLKDVEDNFEHLTRAERNIIGSQKNFDRLLSYLRANETRVDGSFGSENSCPVCRETIGGDICCCGVIEE